ncbi:hypothetical protein CLV60_106200 [Dyadobacter jiangsuensis]|uniref:Uncharacterized protein n=1 Tax=Dyadobacter jiangsuensis TaxID=1591085 RepID=A0A2P8G3R6_9BACT|nr:hypothetical protein CLV60_106200 [Dyadobacter jiangsuensis]
MQYLTYIKIIFVYNTFIRCKTSGCVLETPARIRPFSILSKPDGTSVELSPKTGITTTKKYYT